MSSSSTSPFASLPHRRYRIADSRFVAAIDIPFDHALLVDEDGVRIGIIPRALAELIVHDQSLIPSAPQPEDPAIDDDADDDPAEDDAIEPVDPTPAKTAPTNRHAIPFGTDLPWLAAPHDPAIERPVWDEQRLREQVERFNAGTGGYGERAKQSKVLKDLIARGPWRPLACPDLSVLSALQETTAGFRELFDLVDAARARSPSVPLPPILLLGGPGVGKTFVAQALAAALGASHRTVDMSTLQSQAYFVGSEKYWSDAEPGLLFDLLVTGTHANPTIVLDEVEKISRNRSHDPMHSLHPLLETETAHRLTDLCTEVELDASRVRWILCANSLKPLPASILSRVQIVMEQEPDARERLATTQAVARALLAGLAPDFEPVSRDLIVQLTEMSPRSVRMTLTRAVDRAKRAGRHRVTAQDLSWNSAHPVLVH